jgi:hypothetical protein
VTEPWPRGGQVQLQGEALVGAEIDGIGRCFDADPDR